MVKGADVGALLARESFPITGLIGNDTHGPSACRTHLRSVSAVHPSFDATDCSTAHSDA